MFLRWLNISSVISVNARFKLARNPLGGSFVTLTEFCNTDTGNPFDGIELKKRRNCSCAQAGF